MVVNFEFLDVEPIDNLITCMNYKVDKVIFFGYHKVIEKMKEKTEAFLKEECGVQTVNFLPVSKYNLESTLDIMRKEVEYELSIKNELYFDITGGESLILVAFGILSKEYSTPMHMFDVLKDKIIELDRYAKKQISRDCMPRKVQLTLDLVVKMHGGAINQSFQKSVKLVTNRNINEEMKNDIRDVYDLAALIPSTWNMFSNLMRDTFKTDDSLVVNMTKEDVNHTVMNAGLKSPRYLANILDKLSEKGLILNLDYDDNHYGFQYKNSLVMECITGGGCVLELYTYINHIAEHDEGLIGVHIDWDGIIHSRSNNADVLNEIDVFFLKGNVPTFISCKTGNMDGKNALHALYEIETVANRFGGKYAKKILISLQNLKDVYLERAAEMEIEVR